MGVKQGFFKVQHKWESFSLLYNNCLRDEYSEVNENMLGAIKVPLSIDLKFSLNSLE